MAIPKPLTDYEKKALIAVKNTNDWSMAGLASAIGVGESALRRYLHGTTPLGTKARVAHDKIRSLINGVKISENSSSSRISCGNRPGSFLTDDEVEAIDTWKKKYFLNFTDLAREFGYTYGYITKAIRQEKKVSAEFRNRVMKKLSDPPLCFLSSASEDVPQQEDYTHQFRLRDDYIVNLTLPKNLTDLESERLSLFIKSLVM